MRADGIFIFIYNNQQRYTMTHWSWKTAPFSKSWDWQIRLQNSRVLRSSVQKWVV